MIQGKNIYIQREKNDKVIGVKMLSLIWVKNIWEFFVQFLQPFFNSKISSE